LQRVAFDPAARSVSIDVELPAPAWPEAPALRAAVEAAAARVTPAAAAVAVTFTSRPAPATSALRGLAGVRHVLAVASGKGGVGKSTVAVNLAAALQSLGARVGVFDADIHGPSLPLLLSPPSRDVFKRDDGTITPLVVRGLRAMSFGWVGKRGERAGAIMRGPMVTNVLLQMLGFTDWGELDYLVLDLPPGTGDVPITLTQRVRLDGAVVVTTPHALARAAVVKGLDMFRAVRVPVLALVENMAYFETADGARHAPFGRGHADALATEFAIPHVARLPLTPDVGAADPGEPLVWARPEAPAARAVAALAAEVVRAVGAARVAGAASETTVSWREGRGLVLRTFSRTSAEELVLEPRAVRLACQCAACVDEQTGRRTLAPSDVPRDVRPERVEAVGHYGVAVTWSDGHASSIYSFDGLRALAKALTAAAAATTTGAAAAARA
jgi:Mrp family chromosome partitioning ATPase/DUF971 family protein